MKERQRWQAEEDALLRAYVKQYGPRDWALVAERTGKVLDRDAKSCVERWKNYLKPGIKKGPLSEEEQNLVVRLQEKYGNKWKKIAAEVPGRTAKRLGKWWEVYKEKEKKERERGLRFGGGGGGPVPAEGEHISINYSEMLASFAEKFEQRKQAGSSSSSLLAPPTFLVQPLPPPSSLLRPLSPVACVTPNLNASAPLTETWLPNSLSVGAANSSTPESKEACRSFEGSVDRRDHHASRQAAMPTTTFLHRINPSSPTGLSQTGGRGSGNTVKPSPSSSLPPWMSALPASSSALPAPSATLDLVRSNLRLSLSTSPTDAPLVSGKGHALPTPNIRESPKWGQNYGELTKKTSVSMSDGDDEIMPAVRQQQQQQQQTAWYPPTSTNPQGSKAVLASVAQLQHRRPTLLGIPDSTQLASCAEHCRDLEERRRSWFDERREQRWKIRRLEQQLEAERSAKARQKMEDVAASVRALREEERRYLDCLEVEYKEKVDELHREADTKEGKLVESWMQKHAQLTKLLEELE